MSDVSFTDLPAADLPVSGTEILALVQDGTSKRATVADLLAMAGSASDSWIVFEYQAGDNTDAINAAVDQSILANAAGVRAPWVLPGTTIDIAGRPDLKDQAFQGVSMEHTILLCTTEDAGLDFSVNDDPGVYGYGCINGNFSIAGGPAYMEGIAPRPMMVGPRTMNRFENIRINAASVTDDGVCLLLWSTQNSLFLNINLFNGQTVLRLDGGTANNHFLKCEIAGGTEHHVEFRNDLTPFPGQLDYCFDNVFESTILEWTETTTDALVWSAVGAYNAFFHCPMFVNGHIGGGVNLPTAMNYAVKIELAEGGFSTLQVIGCEMTGYDAVLEAFIGADTSAEILLSAGTMQRAIVGVGGLGVCQMGEECRFFATVTTKLAIFAFRDHRGINRYYGAAGTDLIQRFRIEGASFDLHTVDLAGAHYWGPGSGAVDLNMYRAGVGLLTVTGSLGATGQIAASGRVTAGTGLQVGNSATATTPGTVVRKMEVFNAAGTSLGFVPIYNTIT